MGIIYGLEELPNRKEKYSIVSNDLVENVDVCIIGSGAAGAVLAEVLAKSGRNVVLIERGGYYEGKDMNQREIDMMPLLWKNSGFNFDDNLRIAIAQGCCLGGSTMINDAVCFNTPKAVIEEWRTLGVDFTDQEWSTHLDKVNKALHVYQVTADELNRNNLMLREGATKLGLREHGRNFRNCINCMQCGFCHVGCHYETKQNVLVTFIHNALQNPDSVMRVYCNCYVERIIHKDGVVEGIEGNFVDRDGNKTYRIRVNSRIVIVSAGAIASSKILLKNNISQTTAGRGLCLQPAIQIIGDFDYEIKGNEGIPMAYTVHDFGVTRTSDKSREEWSFKGGDFLLEGIFLPFLEFSIGLSAADITQHQRLIQRYNNYAMAGVVVRDQNRGQVSITASGRASVSYTLGENELLALSTGAEILTKMWFALGAKKVLVQHRSLNVIENEDQILLLNEKIMKDPNNLLLGSAHAQSGNRIGLDPKYSVVDSNCKVHGFGNLFVCDASVFPTAVGVNSRISVMAVASIIASRIVRDWDNIYSKLPLSVSRGPACDISQPMYCKRNNLNELFQIAQSKYGPEGLINSASDKADANNWSFDRETLIIKNNSHWKGIFPRDGDIPNTLVTYTGGFWKRFVRQNSNGVDATGITHPYEVDIRARNKPSEVNLEGFGKVILLEYLDSPYNQFYDVLKMVDDDTILGKAYFGYPTKGVEMLTFTMSRKYPMEFMDEEDHSFLYGKSGKPSFDSMVGVWEGQLVSDSKWSPTLFRFRFYYAEENKKEFKNDYVFGNVIAGTARLADKEDHVEMYDLTGNFHDEMRSISNDLIVGKYFSTPNHVLRWLPEGLSFIHINRERSSITLPYVLKKIGKDDAFRNRVG